MDKPKGNKEVRLKEGSKPLLLAEIKTLEKSKDAHNHAIPGVASLKEDIGIYITRMLIDSGAAVQDAVDVFIEQSGILDKFSGDTLGAAELAARKRGEKGSQTLKAAIKGQLREQARESEEDYEIADEDKIVENAFQREDLVQEGVNELKEILNTTNEHYKRGLELYIRRLFAEEFDRISQINQGSRTHAAKSGSKVVVPGEFVLGEIDNSESGEIRKEVIERLKTKIEEYKQRISDNTAQVARAIRSENDRDLVDAILRHSDTFCKIAIAETLLRDRKVNALELSQFIMDLGNPALLVDFNNAWRVIDMYCTESPGRQRMEKMRVNIWKKILGK